MKRLVFFLLILGSLTAFGDATVLEVQSSTELIVQLSGAEGFFTDKPVVVLSKEHDQIAAIGVIK